MKLVLKEHSHSASEEIHKPDEISPQLPTLFLEDPF
jgi:hypothetical protein